MTTASHPSAQVKDPNSPAWTAPDYDDHTPLWTMARDVAAGTAAVRVKQVAYLPQHPAERWDAYVARLAMVDLFNGFGRTIAGMEGMAFAQEPKLDAAADARLVAEWENIDGAGTHAAVFLRRVFRDALTTGRTGILVDHPSAPMGLTLADEQALKLRAYWIHVTAEQVLSWRLAQIGAETVFTQLVIREDVERPLGVFGTTCVTRYRVYRRDALRGVAGAAAPILWQVWEHPNGDRTRKPVVVLSGALRGVSAIPFAPCCPASDGDVWGGRPPLEDLLHVNLAHYRVTGERRYAMHLACSPVPVRKGASAETREAGSVVLGPAYLIDVEPTGDFYWRTPDAGWAEPTAAELHMLEGRMAVLGLAMLQRKEGEQETARGKEIDNAAQNGTLAGAVGTLKDCAEQAIVYHAEFEQIEPSAVTMNTDFEQIALSPEQVDRYAAMVAASQLSIETMWTQLERGHWLPDDFDATKEKAKIAAAAPVGDGDLGDDPEGDDAPDPPARAEDTDDTEDDDDGQ